MTDADRIRASGVTHLCRKHTALQCPNVECKFKKDMEPAAVEVLVT